MTQRVLTVTAVCAWLLIFALVVAWTRPTALPPELRPPPETPQCRGGEEGLIDEAVLFDRLGKPKALFRYVVKTREPIPGSIICQLADEQKVRTLPLEKEPKWG